MLSKKGLNNGKNNLIKGLKTIISILKRGVTLLFYIFFGKTTCCGRGVLIVGLFLKHKYFSTTNKLNNFIFY